MFFFSKTEGFFWISLKNPKRPSVFPKSKQESQKNLQFSQKVKEIMNSKRFSFENGMRCLFREDGSPKSLDFYLRDLHSLLVVMLFVGVDFVQQLSIVSE